MNTSTYCMLGTLCKLLHRTFAPALHARYYHYCSFYFPNKKTRARGVKLLKLSQLISVGAKIGLKFVWLRMLCFLPLHHTASHPSVILELSLTSFLNSALISTYTFQKQLRYMSPLSFQNSYHHLEELCIPTPGVFYKDFNFFLTCFDTILLLSELNSFSRQIT